LTCGGCRQPPRASIDEEARTYVRLAVALGEHDPDSLDFYAGPPDLVADTRRDPPPLSAIRRDAVAAIERLGRPIAAPPDRVASLIDNLSAIVARVDLLGGRRSTYVEEAKPFFGAGVVVDGDRPNLDDVRSRIDRLIGGSGPLADRYAAFASTFLVPADRLSAVMAAALDACRQRTRAHLALPSNERVAIEYVHDRPWSAYSRYRGSGQSTIQLNTDFRFTLDQALQVACHEGYPGHHTRNLLMDDASRPERSVQLTFSPEAVLGEASAMAAVDIAFPAETRVSIERDRLAPLAGLAEADIERHVAVEVLAAELQQAQAPIAEAYIDGRLEFERAVDALERDALVPHAEALVKYINEYRTYVSAYTDAARLFAAHVAACRSGSADDETAWRCFRREMTKPRLVR
jgi:hypothetical protein